ncbi:hypothetical protein GURKE_00520 [Brevundimonas phage vB_BpoS-Gurke]|uniref:Uncharacterized protein n=1 Tax=Brevundimonas phage vB_BpoS-Gurke TaxID=2948599 RepID=A0A9E7SQP3_9CAUD|nr:hypothetical protein GURKE_00520 [Brevundimonas phage vB_BpoS-Gurke]
MVDLPAMLRANMAKDANLDSVHQERIILMAQAAAMVERLQAELDAAQQVNRVNHDLIGALRRESAENEGAYKVWRRRADLSVESMRVLAGALYPFALYAEKADLFPESEGSFGEIIVRGLREEIRWSDLRRAREVMQTYRENK